MDNDALRIPKKLQQVELWIHPEGRVIGSVYLHLQSSQHAGEEKPEEMLNQPEPFLVLKCNTPEELRFYNKKSIVRVHYYDDQAAPTVMMTLGSHLHAIRSSAASAGLETLGCSLYMTDGSVITGAIKEFLLPGQDRLFDYINGGEEAFIKLHLESGDVCLINKAYIVRVSPV
jgi:hypothetical protein